MLQKLIIIGENFSGDYKDAESFCKSATLEEVKLNNCILTPGRYVDAEEDDGIPYDEKMTGHVQKLNEQFAKALNWRKLF